MTSRDDLVRVSGDTNYCLLEISRISKRLNIKQQAVATAQLYIKRFYSKVEIRRTNPYLVLVTALYLACKMEECPQHIRMFVTEARSLWPGTIDPYIHIERRLMG